MERGRGRRLFVSGGSGFLGSHVVAAARTSRWEVLAPSSQALDLRDRAAVDAIVEWRPTAIIHTAYRRDERASIVDATRHVARAAEQVDARVVHLSTDAVFAGRAAPYTESDGPDPVHAYGLDKADAEREVARHDPPALIVRTSLLVGGDEPSGHELAVRDAASGRRAMAFFTDEIRCPVLVQDLAAALVLLADRVEVTGVLHLAGPDALSRADLARLAARRWGWDSAALHFSTLEAAGLRRPGVVVLDSSRARRLGLAVRGPSSWT